MDLVVGDMDSLLGKLSNLLAQEYALIRGVRGDIQYIGDELSSMRAFLLDLAQDDQDNRKKDWMKQIREMAYDCEDCIDDFAHRLPRESSNFYCKCSPWTATLVYDLWTWGPRRQIASNIAELKVRAQLIAERRIRYGVENPQSRKLKGTSEFPTYDIAEDQLPRRELTMKEPVGTRAVMEELEKWVKEAGEGRAVASIVGFGGVGKTTIAMVLYHKVMKDFECRAWVTVSQNYDQRTVLTEILKQINPDHKEHDSCTFSEKTNRAACITRKFKRAMQLRGGNMQRGNPGISSMAQTRGCTKLESTVKEHLTEKRYTT
ncbi:disease resistance protein Pik-2-like [Miscanthus floridulus]|uniref:disease resistance protein Pik-2-like n=1 Tax=Miscanthus floridulus TaxID=154761 RepID=UPI00345A2EDF